jgi:hypothetical protein
MWKYLEALVRATAVSGRLSMASRPISILVMQLS